LRERCISIKSLYEKYGEVLEHNYIDYTYQEENGNHYYDLKNKDTHELVCMDGETCLIIEANDSIVRLQNSDGEVATTFVLTKEEFEVSIFN
jgi:hypothetical protein